MSRIYLDFHRISILLYYYFKFRAKLGSENQQNFSVFFQTKVNKRVRDLITNLTWNYFVSVRIVQC